MGWVWGSVIICVRVVCVWLCAACEFAWDHSDNAVHINSAGHTILQKKILRPFLRLLNFHHFISHPTSPLPCHIPHPALHPPHVAVVRSGCCGARPSTDRRPSRPPALPPKAWKRPNSNEAMKCDWTSNDVRKLDVKRRFLFRTVFCD